MSVPGEAMLASVKRTASVPKRFDDLDGVDDVALGLRHLLAIGVADEGVDVDLAEGDGVGEGARGAVGHRDVEHEVGAEHDHAGDPEEEDVEAGDEELGGIEGWRSGWVAAVAGPAEDGKGKQAGGEPGVEDVGFLADVGDAAAGAGGRVSRVTVSLPQASQYQAGMRWPHQSWREMHQSWMLPIHSK